MKRFNLRLNAAVFGFYLLLAVIITFPLITQLGSVLVGFDYGDAHEMAHHIWWFTYSARHDAPPFYQTLLAYPDGIDGITLWANPLQFFPAWLLAFVLPLPAAANITILLTMALNGWAMWLLVRWLLTPHPLTPSPTQAGRGVIYAALVAGAVFMLYPTMQGHLGAGHAGLMVQWGAPLYVYGLLRLREDGSERRIFFAALMLLVTVWGHSLQVIYVVLPVSLVIVLWLIYRREWAALRRVIAAGVIGAAAFSLFLFPVLASTVGTEVYADAGGSVRYSADLLSIVTPSFFHPLFGRLDYTRQVLGINLDEGAAYLGIVAGVLCVIGLIARRESRPFGWLALLAYLFALGPLLKIFEQPVMFTIDGYASYITLPGAALTDLPLFNLARTPGRFNFTLALAVAVMAGYGVHRVLGVLTAQKRRWVAPFISIITIVLIAFEYQTFFPLPTIPAEIPPEVAALRNRDEVRAVFNAPYDNLVAAKYALYLQTAHEQPLIAGQVTRVTPVNPAKLALLQTFDPALLGHVGADVVILHRQQDDGTLEARARELLGDPFFENTRIAMFNVPFAEAAPDFMTVPPLSAEVSAQLDLYAYTARSGWITLNATLSAPDPRGATLLLNGDPVHRWTVEGDLDVSLPLPVTSETFNTVSLALDQTCPQHFHASLECRSVSVMDATLDFIPQDAPHNPIHWRRGVTLERWRVPATELDAGETVNVWLVWQFAEPRTLNDIRYVHILDQAGLPVAQLDAPIGEFDAGARWVDTVRIELPADLAPGEYRVVTGWYEYPSITNFCLDNEGCVQFHQVDTITVE